MSICQALPLLEKSAVNEFSDIRKEINTSVTFPTTYITSLEIQEALSSKIVKNSGNYTYSADFGVFQSETDAKNKIEQVYSLIKNCFPGFRMTVSFEKLLKTGYFTLSYHNENGFRLYNARFELHRYATTFEVDFVFKSSEKASFMNSNPNQAYNDYQLVKNEMAYDNFSIAIRNVIKEGKTGFSAIKGEEANFGSLFTTYVTKYSVPDYTCYIEDRIMGTFYYTVQNFKRGKMAELSQTVEQAKNQIQSALGTGYGVTISSNLKTLTYAHKDQPEKPVMKLILSGDETDFVLTLLIVGEN